MKLWSEKIKNHSCTVEMIQSFVGNLKITRGETIVFETLVDLDFHADVIPNNHDIKDWRNICTSYMHKNKIPNLMVV